MRSTDELLVLAHTTKDRRVFKNALKTILQNVLLTTLSECGFFEKCVFYGGTCLSMFYDVHRLSEDLDFQIMQDVSSVDFDLYSEQIKKAFVSKGMKSCLFTVKNKTGSKVLSAKFSINALEMVDRFFIRNELVSNTLIPNERIKVSIDINNVFIEGFSTLEKEIEKGMFIKIMDASSLLSCKIAAIMERDSVRKHIKGRDFYDFLSLVGAGVKANRKYLLNQLNRNEHLYADVQSIKESLRKTFERIDMDSLKDDLFPFVLDSKKIKGMTRDQLISALNMLTFHK